MASILRQIVAGPRSRHPEANLDLCYVTDNIIATSGPSITYPSLAYRNPLSELVTFLDSKHRDQWCLFEFRAEGCGYRDEDVYGRIWHWPWPDHHPPPYALVPQILGSMKAWLTGADAMGIDGKFQDSDPKRVAVVHCKAGKGRSGTMAVSYMMTHQGWTKTDALKRFTDRRMRPGFGAGVSIPSQLRWLDYVERWAGYGGKIYVERPAEVIEVHVWGLRDGVKIAVEGFVEKGKKIKVFHVFDEEERDDASQTPVEQMGGPQGKSNSRIADAVQDVLRRQKSKFASTPRLSSPVGATGGSFEQLGEHKLGADGEKALSNTLHTPSGFRTPSSTASSSNPNSTSEASRQPAASVGSTANVIFRPSKPVRLTSSDINLAVERRASAGYGVSTVTSVAHVWFNCFFEGNGPENYQKEIQDNAGNPRKGEQSGVESPWAEGSGVFAIRWDAMDGIKGSSRKGARAFDKVAVVWRVAWDEETALQDEAGNGSGGTVIAEPGLGEKIRPLEAADWGSEGANMETELTPTKFGATGVFEVEGKIVAERAQESEGAGGKAALTASQLAIPDDNVEEDGVEGLRHGVIDGPDNGVSGPALAGRV